MFVIGAVAGAVVGLLIGWIRYGAFEPGHFSSHVLGGALILGLVFLGVAALRSWLRRNPL